MKIKMGMKIKIAITNYQIYINNFIMKHVLEKLSVTSPWKPGALWNTQYTYMVLTIIISNFNRKSTTTYTKRKVAKARPGILEQL
jgi:hypothetical protein